MPISSVFSPYSAQASAIANLFTIALVIGAVVLGVVAVLVIYFSLRFRRRAGEEGEPRQASGNRRLEITWTVIPILIVLALFVLSLRTMAASDPSTEGGQPDMIVIGHQWWWEIRYPKTGIITANEAHIPAGQRILLQLQSVDVIHDWWVPNLGRKIDLNPDFPTQMWIEADKPGIYLGACAEYCGTEHAWMRIRVIADPPDQFSAWEQAQLHVPAQPTGGEAALGAQVFQQNTCIACHTIAGSPAQARVGPDLTHVADRQTLGAGVINNTPENLARWIKDPQAIKPGNYMPSLRLSDADVNAIAAYLESLK
jgi:cytochrome c oxidase subunit II